MTVERRPVAIAELADFEEVGECGTAVVITPVSHLDDKPFLESEDVTRYTYVEEGCGPKSQRLYDFITGIQYAEIEDPFGWNVEVEL
jgi:branched-chain amino acid aminotransferase